MTSQDTSSSVDRSKLPSQSEFIALIAFLVATVAFSIDGMLPALPMIAQEFSPDTPNNAQLIVISFVLGMGVGTLFTGPLSDAFGRKSVLVWGAALYIASSVYAIYAGDLEQILGARFVQGLGAAAPRIVALAIVRDLYQGRSMARIMSFVMMVFTLVPAVAPLIGAELGKLAGWRTIFWAFAVFAVLTTFWAMLRLPETLPKSGRRPFEADKLMAAVAEMWRHPVVRMSILIQGLTFAILFATIATIQPIFEVTFQMADSFPIWFGVTAILAIPASYVNARLVMTLGMRRMVSFALLAQICLSTAMVLVMGLGLSGTALFVAFFVWQLSLFFQAGLSIGNLNALAMEPMGHIAGMAASVVGSLATVIAVALAAPVGLMFDGTPMPLTIGVLLFSMAGFILMRSMRRHDEV